MRTLRLFPSHSNVLPAPGLQALVLAAALFAGGTSTIHAAEPEFVFSHLAGSTGAPGSEDGSKADARFAYPSGVAVDATGNIFVADTGNHTVRKINRSGEVSTVAGAAGEGGDVNGSVTAARFSQPNGIVALPNGDLLVSDSGYSKIRKISGNFVTTFAGSVHGKADGTGAAAQFYYPVGLALKPNGDLLVADLFNGTVRNVTSDAVVTTIAGVARVGLDLYSNAALNSPAAVAVDGDGWIYVAESALVRRFNPASGFFTPRQSDANYLVLWPDSFSYSRGLAATADGVLYVSDPIGQRLLRQTKGGVAFTLSGTVGVRGLADGAGNMSLFNEPCGLALDSQGNLYVADRQNHSIRRITPSGITSTVAGSRPPVFGAADGYGPEARFNRPQAIALYNGDLYIADTGNHAVRKVGRDGAVTTFAGSPDRIGSLDGPVSRARFSVPSGIAVDQAGNIYVADNGNRTVRKITAGGLVETIARSFGAQSAPHGIAADQQGSVYFTNPDRNTVHRISAAGEVTILAGADGQWGRTDGVGGTARFAIPKAIAVNDAGTVFVADVNTVRRITPGGVVSTMAGNPNRSGLIDGGRDVACFANLHGLAIYPDGALYAIDDGTVRRIESDGHVTTVAGKSGRFGGVNGAASEAAFNDPQGIAADAAGNLYIADTENHAIRKATTATAAASTTRMVNLSIRSRAGKENNTLIVGFVIAGSGSKQLLVRGLGPALLAYGVTDALADPKLELYRSGAVFDANDNWGGGVTLAQTFSTLGATGLTASSKDAALLRGLESGPYSAHVTSANSTAGIALAEIYDTDKMGPRLVNISARSEARTGDDILVAGFVLAGAGPKTLLIRALGPTLGSLGVEGAMADPLLKLFKAGAELALNDNWGGTAPLKSAFGIVGAAALQADASKDSALLVTLEPGVYSTQVSGVNESTGVALVEIYELP